MTVKRRRCWLLRLMQIAFDTAAWLEGLLIKAATTVPPFGQEPFVPQVRPADPRFGDFQANGVLPHAKKLGTNPRALASALVEAFKNLPEIKQTLAGAEPDAVPFINVDIAGPGFLNFTLSADFAFAWLKAFASEADLKTAAASRLKGRKIVIDYPSPNTAKQMHIGHLRPMVIGSAVQGLLAFCGADITCDNHIGDWGTNFGTLIMAIKREKTDLAALQPATALEEIERLYKLGSALEKEDVSLRELSRAELVKLQNGDAENTALWQQIVAVSNEAFEENYRRLGVKPDLTLGESFYRDKVERIYRELTEAGLAGESEGALVVFHPEHPRFAEQPFIIRKKDGASNYASTDLATLIYRVEELDAEEIIYVTDGRQQDHFEQLFLTAKKWFAQKGYRLPKLEHVWFGTILGEDGKAIKTRSGEPIRLRQLLDEAVQRAHAIVVEKNPELPASEQQEIAETVGIGAIRYADLSQTRTQDYVFSWEKLLSFDGNTAPYLQYAVARIHAIFRKAGIAVGEGEANASAPQTPAEIALAKKLLTFPQALEQAAADLRPHVICSYLYELAGAFSTFYNADKVIVDEADIKARRLALCARTLATLETGLHLLGIRTLTRM